MKRKPEKPIYGNYQGAKSSGIDLDLGNPEKSKSSQDRSKSGELFDARTQKLQRRSRRTARFIKVAPVELKSFPRMMFKVGMLGLVIYQGLIHTQIGRSLTAKISRQVSSFNTQVETTRSKVNIKALTKNRQKNADDRFDDAWNRAGGDPKQKR